MPAGNTVMATPTPAPTSITCGPLYGNSASALVNTTNGTYAIWDQNDGSLNVNMSATPPIDETLAFQWTLGDDNLDNLIDDMGTGNPETLRLHRRLHSDFRRT